MNTDAESHAPRARRFSGALPMLLAAAALVHPLATLLAPWDWRADLLTHFQGPAMVVTLVAVLALARRHRRAATALALLAAAQALPLVRYSGSNPVPPDPGGRNQLRILMANVLVFNEEYDRLARLIRQEDPDVVGLVEVSPAWLAGLADVRAAYPHRLEAPAGADGLALWSKLPWLSEGPPERPIPEGWPALHATLDLGGRPSDLWLVHPRSPLRPGRRSGNPELAALGRRVGAARGSRIVVGDLNCTDGSPHFRRFLHASGLRDSRPGFGAQASWPAWSPYRIAIDHAFLSPDLAVVDRRLGPEIGSDHRPLIVDLAPAAPASSRAVSRPPTHASQSSESGSKGLTRPSAG